jgi:hypothetical protein
MKDRVAFRRLAELGKEIGAAVDEMLLAGETPARVAKWLHEEKGVLLDIKTASVKKNLERYRAVDLARKVKDELKKSETKLGVAIPKKKMNAMIELEELVEIQKGRLDKVLIKEKGLPEGILLKQASDEARLLKETLVELGKLQLETGVMRRAPKTVSGTSFNPETGEVRQFAWTEEQEQLLKQLEGVDYERLGDTENNEPVEAIEAE